RKRGLLIITHALQSATTASTVRIRSGKLSVSDGPFAESKEQLGGFFLIEAGDFHEAIEVAAKWPSGRVGKMDGRAIEEELRMDRATASPHEARIVNGPTQWRSGYG